jgi:hypothetical protein
MSINKGVSKNSENLPDKFDMGYQKINMRSRSEKVDFFLGDFLRQLHLKAKYCY